MFGEVRGRSDNKEARMRAYIPQDVLQKLDEKIIQLPPMPA